MTRTVGLLLIAILTCSFFGAGILMIANIKPKTLIEDEQQGAGEEDANHLQLSTPEDESRRDEADV
jgi:hypothetical protein